jgi:uncharacterized protein YecT (DUF1311 family)
VKVDYEAARKCAWAERLAVQADMQPKYSVASLFGGSAMLTVLYANGEGVEQDIPLSLRFACEAGLPDRGLNDIASLSSNSTPSRKRFRYCDEAFTTFEMNFCAALDAEIAKQKRSDVFLNLSLRWPKEQQAEFKTLVRVHEAYVIARGRGETDQGGTIRGLRVNGVEERMRDKFLAALQSFEAGHFPHGSESDFRRVDAELNVLYRRAIAAADAHKKDYDGAIQPEGIRDAELTWLKYRDAWVAFAKLSFPTTDSNAWLTLLTTNRAASLRVTLCGIDDKDSECPRK